MVYPPNGSGKGSLTKSHKNIPSEMSFQSPSSRWLSIYDLSKINFTLRFYTLNLNYCQLPTSHKAKSNRGYSCLDPDGV